MYTLNYVQIFFLVVELVGALNGNLLLLYLLKRQKAFRRSTSSYFVINSTVVNLTNAVINIPLALDYIVFHTGHLNGVVAPIAVTFTLLFWTLLILHSTLIVVINRLLIIKFPLTSCTSTSAKIMVVLVWIGTLLCSCLISTIDGLQTPPAYTSPLQHIMKEHDTDPFLLVYMLALLVTIAVFCAIVCKDLIRSRVDLQQEKKSTAQVVKSRKRTAHARNTVLLITTKTIISFIPALLILCLKSADTVLLDPVAMVYGAIFGLQLNSFVDPFVLIFRSSTFRRSTKILVRKVLCNGIVRPAKTSRQRRRNSAIDQTQRQTHVCNAIAIHKKRSHSI